MKNIFNPTVSNELQYVTLEDGTLINDPDGIKQEHKRFWQSIMTR
jgi:hypothetical protein